MPAGPGHPLRNPNNIMDYYNRRGAPYILANIALHGPLPANVAAALAPAAQAALGLAAPVVAAQVIHPQLQQLIALAQQNNHGVAGYLSLVTGLKGAALLVFMSDLLFDIRHTKTAHAIGDNIHDSPSIGPLWDALSKNYDTFVKIVQSYTKWGLEKAGITGERGPDQLADTTIDEIARGIRRYARNYGDIVEQPRKPGITAEQLKLLRNTGHIDENNEFYQQMLKHEQWKANHAIYDEFKKREEDLANEFVRIQTEQNATNTTGTGKKNRCVKVI